MERCGCGFEAEKSDGPTHAYMLSTTGCWEAYGRLLAREYEDPSRWRVHRLSVDAYAVQHPGVDVPQARNSVGMHLSRLGLIFERGWALERANDAMLAITAKKFSYPWLTPPSEVAGVTVEDVLAAETGEAHMQAVEGWAQAVWQSWAEHHATVCEWLQQIR
jgi:uncharacterized protein DUF5946